MEIRSEINQLPQTGFVRLLGMFKGDTAKKRMVDGPVPGGTFWALGACNDLPVWTEQTRAAHLSRPEFFDRFDVWYRDADGETDWIKISCFCPDGLFGVVYEDSWDSDIVTAYYPNGLPEFYAIKKGAK